MFDLLKKKLSNWLSSSSKKDEAIKQPEKISDKPVNENIKSIDD